jgi:hypothetical protein
MPDYLDTLIARSREPSVAIQPHVPSLFEPVPPNFGPDAGSLDSGSEAPPAGRDIEPGREAPPSPAAAREFAITEAAGFPRPLSRREPAPARPQAIDRADQPDRLEPRLATLERDLAQFAPPAIDPRTALRPPASREFTAPPPPEPRTDQPEPPSVVQKTRETKLDQPLPPLPPGPPQPEVIQTAGEEAKARPSRLARTLSERLTALERDLAAAGRVEAAPPAFSLPPATPAPVEAAPGQSTILPNPEKRRRQTPDVPLRRPPMAASGHQTLVQVTIGRVEVRAGRPETPQRTQPSRIAPTSLQEYLRRRNGG